MEAKKNSTHDLHRQSVKFFFIGLCISVTLVITAFEWTTIKKKAPLPTAGPVEEPLFSVKATVHENEKPPTPPKPLLTKSIPSVSLTEFNTENVDKFVEPAANTEINDNPYVDLPIEEIEDLILFPEVQAMPIGGYESFYDQLSKSLKYPKQAQRNQITGRVFVEFIIDKTGAVSNLKILKGIGGGCDEEALRVLAKTQWEPGRQRGKPVKTRMAMPINFTLR
jgi:periplasmic protein TonB